MVGFSGILGIMEEGKLLDGKKLRVGLEVN